MGEAAGAVRVGPIHQLARDGAGMEWRALWKWPKAEPPNPDAYLTCSGEAHESLCEAGPFGNEDARGMGLGLVLGGLEFCHLV